MNEEKLKELKENKRDAFANYLKAKREYEKALKEFEEQEE
jgi:hypothetical protein